MSKNHSFFLFKIKEVCGDLDLPCLPSFAAAA